MDYLFFALLALITAAVFYLRSKYQYWSSRNVYQFQPTLWLLGNAASVFLGRKSFGETFTDWYKELKRKGQRFGGGYILTKPVLVVADPAMVKQICVTDFQHFNSHAAFLSEGTDPLRAHLFNLEGAKWKSMRVKLTPTFTSGKMKMMFNTIQACTSGFKEMLSDSIKTGEAVDIKDVLGRFTTDVIGSCAFGIDCNSIKDPDTEFRIYGKKVFDTGRIRALKSLVFMALPRSVLRLLNLKVTSHDVESFFMNLVKNNVKYREEHNVVRKDFMHMMLQLKNKGKVTDDDDFKTTTGDTSSALNMDEVTAQAYVFFVAGFETSSTTMTFALYQLTQNQEIQDKVRKEINEVLQKHNGQVTYEAVMEMHYLDRVINETLRRHSAVISLPRACTKDYRIPGTDITITKGTHIQIPVLGIHMDPEYYPNPEKFDPERFTEENKAKMTPFTYLPFGEGPRICIGLRFGVLQAKIGLIALLKKYRVKLNKKTQVPLQQDANSIVNTAKGGVWINVENL